MKYDFDHAANELLQILVRKFPQDLTGQKVLGFIKV